MAEAKVLFDYQASQDDELTIIVGDIIKNVVMSDGGWWEGEKNGQKGLFPDNFVEIISTGKNDNSNRFQIRKGHITEMANKIKDGIQIGAMMSSKKISVGSKKKKLAKVQFEYIPEAEDELELHIGDVLEVYREVEEGWWEGQLNGKVGMFPSNFVEIRENPDEEEREKSVKTDEPEKKDSSIDPETKGKKVKGVGFGNIFGSGPIKLRPSSGVWKGETEESKAPKIKKTYSTSSQDSSVLSSQNNKSTRSNNESNKVDNKHNNNKDSLLGTNVQSSFKRIRDNDSVDKSSLPALPTKKPFLPPPVGKKPAPLKTELSKQPTIDNKDLSKSKVSANVSENKNKDTHKEKDSRDKGFSDFDNFEVPAAEKLVHLTANRVKQPKKRPPSLVFLHSEEEKTEIKETKEKEPLQGEKKQPAVPTAATSIKATIRTENKEVSKFDSVPSHVVAESHTKAKSPSGTTSFEVLAQNEIGSNFTSDEVKELILEIKELKKEMVSKSCYDELKADNEQLHQEIEALKSSFQRRFRNIVNELDEEKKVRLNMQVEIDRMKMLISESTI
ncbi:SH3 domain-containing kinase-binding protein 1 isoform X3 [Octopus sinensis]|uniref:SH3 domain-containing kinase-binding protein 1 isoform X3 n=1 Tax=Octopus sinensis TaxID=2607531 RepID=A0A7E6FI29_9MOLL|nr:SH3 domain-containing kinase-binding protein 1 isoform X3 [Octopus sinensis]